MGVLVEPGDEVRGERIICVYRTRGPEALVHQTGGHRATRTVIKGLPARAIVDRLFRFVKRR